MHTPINREISNEEILVRFIFNGHFKNSRKAFLRDNLKVSEIFSDNRNLGVSLQREAYCNEIECKKRAKNIPSSYTGFVIFRKNSFDETVQEHLEHRPNFEVILKSTPLDEELTAIAENIEVYLDTLSNPSHADIIYINPAVDPTDTSPHTSVRVFSKNLMRKSSLIVDLDSDNEHLSHCLINDIDSNDCYFKNIV